MDQKIKEQEIGMKAIIIDMSEVLIHTSLISKNAWKTTFSDLFRNNNTEHPFSDDDY